MIIGKPKRTGSPWTDRDNKLLGTATDASVARTLQRTEKAVAQQRSALGIAAFARNFHKWTKRELAMFGKYTQREIAAAAGVSRPTVIRKQKELGVKSKNSHNSPVK